MPKPQRNIFCKSSRKSISYSSSEHSSKKLISYSTSGKSSLEKSPRKSSAESPRETSKSSSPEKSVKIISLSPMKDDSLNRKRSNDGDIKDGELTKKKFKRISFP